MKLGEIKELMEAFDGMNICRLELEDGPFSIILSKEHVHEHGYSEQLRRQRESLPEVLVVQEPPASETDSAPAVQPENRVPVLSPVVGVFYSAPSPGAPAFVQVGDRVQKGQTLCIVEAMKMMNEIAAEQDGIVAEIVAEDGQLVEYGTPLIYMTK